LSSQATPKERLTAYQRWELDSFDTPAPGRKAVILPTAEQVERMHQQAHQEGYAAGYREGAAAAAAEAARLQQIASALTEEAQQFDQRLGEELLGLALAISRQVLKQALKVHPELILPVIAEVLGHVPQTHRRAHLAVHPEDAALVRARLGDQLTRSGWEILEDAQMQRGGCRVHAPDCDVDATLERRWQRVVAAIGEDQAWIQ
jgi:flagellar assembly protein FliH